MLPFDSAFEGLLLKRIRGLKIEDLQKYEGLLALQVELSQTLKIYEFETGYELQWPDNRERYESEEEWKKYVATQKEGFKDLLKKQIARAETLAQEIIKPFAKEFNALHALWIARRGLALRQGNYFQLPFSLQKLGRYVSAWGRYRKTQVQTGLTFFPIRIKGGWGFCKNLFGARTKPRYEQER